MKISVRGRASLIFIIIVLASISLAIALPFPQDTSTPTKTATSSNLSKRSYNFPSSFASLSTPPTISNLLLPKELLPIKTKAISPTSSCSKAITNPIKQKTLRKSNITELNVSIVSQVELKPAEFLRELQKDSDFNDINEYAKELGYTHSNKSMKMGYSDGGVAIISSLAANNEKIIFLVKYSRQENNFEKSFLVEIGKENETPILKMFDKNSGIVLNFSDFSVISSWGHHSCEFWTCVHYGIYAFLLDPLIGYVCYDFCTGMCLNYPSWITCAPCIGCIIGAGGTISIQCSSQLGDLCYWYPCQEDCTDQNYYGGWEYYCKNNDRYMHKWYYARKCEHDNPGESGNCVSDSANSGWVATTDTFVEPCPYGCNEATNNCYDAITCYADPDCGDSGWTGSPSCSGGDVWQNWREYTCYNPGTESSYCDYDDDYILKQECTSGECSSGECVESESCEDPDYPWYCPTVLYDCWGCYAGNEDRSTCCPEGSEEMEVEELSCCLDVGPYCDTSTGECDVCGGNYPYECNGGCWGCTIMEGFEVCCPSSGNPQYCCNAAASVCMNDGSCCVPSTETCNNQDDDCDGVVDSFSEGCGAGACAGGTRTCTSGSWGACSTAGLASNETCNNIDDDCDGSVDENLIQECGTDTGACIKGNQTCSAGNWMECGGSYVAPINETCNDIDDNCNNITDEGNVCGDYPNITLVFPPDNYIAYSNNITFNCSAMDDVNLANITLYHSINGTFLLNETKSLAGTSNSSIWAINNIPFGTNFTWNCFAYDNDSHLSWGEFPYSVNITRQIISFNVTNLQILYSNSTLRVFEFWINNAGTGGNLTWAFTTGDGTVINSQNVTLQANEAIPIIIEYNYSNSGQFTVTANATSGDVTNSSSTIVNVGSLLVTEINDLYTNKSEKVFEFKIKNNENASLSNINWSFDTGEGIIIYASNLMNLSGAEEAFVYFGYNYSSLANRLINATAFLSSGVGHSKIKYITYLNVSSLEILNASYSKRIFGFNIKNLYSSDLTGLYWNMTMGDGSSIDSTQTVILIPNEEIFILAEHNYTSNGTFQVNATAQNGTLIDSKNISISVA